MPDFDFDAFNHEESSEEYAGSNGTTSVVTSEATAPEKIAAPEPVAEDSTPTSNNTEEVDKW